MAIFALLAALAVADAAAPFPDPIAPAADGHAQCYSPDLAGKTCASLASYSRDAAGGLAIKTTVLLARNPPATMTTTASATIVNSRLCSDMHAADLNAATFTVGGAAPDDAAALRLHEAVSRAFAPIIDHTICVTFEPDGSRFIAHTALDGLPRPALDQRVMWVAPGEGWKVAP